MSSHPLKGRKQTPEAIAARRAGILAAAEKRREQDPQWMEEDRGHDTPCWVWQRGLNAKGYPRLSLTCHGVKKTYRAHRYFYEQHVGPIPAGMTLDHLCNVRCCINPAHLEPVTQAENVRRGLARRKALGLPRYTPDSEVCR